MAIQMPVQTDTDLVMQLRACSFYYGSFRAVADVSLPIYKNKITAFIGPSGCGKSTVLRGINRMLELVPRRPRGWRYHLPRQESL